MPEDDNDKLSSNNNNRGSPASYLCVFDFLVSFFTSFDASLFKCRGMLLMQLVDCGNMLLLGHFQLCFIFSSDRCLHDHEMSTSSSIFNSLLSFTCAFSIASLASPLDWILACKSATAVACVSFNLANASECCLSRSSSIC